jgi:hypothetical protein
MTTISPQNQPTTGVPESPESIPCAATVRSNAVKRVESKRALVSHAVSYVVVNSFLVAIWLLSGAGHFWPGWIIAGWGVGLVLNVWDTYWRRPITEADVEAEIRRQRGRSATW